MRLFRYSFSSWWLLLLAPLFLLLLPSIPLALIIGSHFVGAIIGPPAIWEMPRRDLSMQEISGTYIETENDVYGNNADYDNTGALLKGIALIELRADGSAVATNIPQDDPTSWSASPHRLCLLSGRGTS